jgi:hypothetical protein
MRQRGVKGIQATPHVCETCGGSFLFKDHPSNLKLGRGRFCSKDCQRQWQTIPLDVRFAKYVGTVTSRGCILWTGGKNADGYGIIGSGGETGANILAHRLSYERANGAIPVGLMVLHKCDNPPCINVEHLYLGTAADNTADMVARRRYRKRTPGSRRYLQDLRRAAKNGKAVT